MTVFGPAAKIRMTFKNKNCRIGVILERKIKKIDRVINRQTPPVINSKYLKTPISLQ